MQMFPPGSSGRRKTGISENVVLALPPGAPNRRFPVGCSARANLTFEGAQNRRSRDNLTFKGASNRRSRAYWTVSSVINSGSKHTKMQKIRIIVRVAKLKKPRRESWKCRCSSPNDCSKTPFRPKLLVQVQLDVQRRPKSTVQGQLDVQRCPKPPVQGQLDVQRFSKPPIQGQLDCQFCPKSPVQGQLDVQRCPKNASAGPT